MAALDRSATSVRVCRQLVRLLIRKGGRCPPISSQA
jgi:hypothetical protein